MPQHSDNIFCPLPFAHTNVNTDGSYQICCRHPTPTEHALNIKQATFDQWNSSDYVNQVRQSFVENQKHPGCSNCWKLEALGQQSYRQRIVKDYDIFKVTADFDNLINIELNLGNLCNLTCLMCDERFSSAILSENKKLGINQFNQKDFSWSDQAFENLYQMFSHRPKVLSLIGGEPLYIKQFLDILDQVPEEFFKETMLHITTNATVWNQRWSKVIQKFKLVRMTFSIDATQELYEYIRFPSNWNNVTNNIQQIRTLPNVKPLVNCVVQNLNVAKLYDLISWCQQQDLWLTLSQLTRPSYLAMTNLPVMLKKQAIQELDRCLSIPNIPDHVSKFVISCQQQLSQHAEEFDQALWSQCTQYLQVRDTVRGNSHRKFLIY